MKTKTIVKLAMVAALYIALTVGIAPLSYGDIQFRFAEILVLLCFFRRDYAYALIIGCFVANWFSPMGIYDVVFGTLQTAFSAIMIGRSRHLWVAIIYPVASMVIIALELYWILDLPFWMSLLTTTIGEFVVVGIIGFPLFTWLQKNEFFLKLIEANQNIGGLHEI